MRDAPDVVAFALAVVVVVSAVALPVSALGGPTMATDGGTEQVAPQTAGNGTTNGTESLAPGQRLAGVVGVQGAEIDGELEERTLATRVSRAESNESKAAVVATELNTARDRLQRLRETQTDLREARQSGDISRGEYRARMAVTAAQIRAVQTQLDSSEAVSRDLPAAALEARGVNREELDRLRADADELRGPEVAEIARDVAGDDEGRELDPERGPDELPEPARDDDEDEEDEEDENADDAGRPDDPGNGNASASGNRSTGAGPPDDAGQSDEADDDAPGNSGEAGDGEDAPGNSREAGNSDDGEDGDASPGNSGHSDDAGNSGEDAPGNSGEAGNSDDGDDGDDSPGNSGNSDDAGNDDSTDDDGDDAGNSGNSDDDGDDAPGNSGNDGDSDDSPGNRGGNR